MRLKALKEQIRFCKLCYSTLEVDGITGLLDAKCVLCARCSEKLDPKFETFSIDGVKGVAVYDYDDLVQQLIFQLKHNNDYEIGEIFLSRFRVLLRVLYAGYVLVPAPSYADSDAHRGFNHVEAIFSVIGLPLIRVFAKTTDQKQKELSARERQEISKVIKLGKADELKGKKVLIVDDIKTTGSTIRAMVKLLQGVKLKKLKIMVLSKTIDTFR